MTLRTRKLDIAAAALLLTASVAAIEPPSTTELARAESALALADGVVLGPDRDVVYLLGTDGLSARTVADGRVAWRTPEKRKPLGFYGEHLVVFGPGDASGRGGLSFIDTATGDAVDQLALAFPEPVAPLLADGPGRRFTIASEIDGADLLVTWEYVSLPLRGAPPSRDSAPPTAGTGTRAGDAMNRGADDSLRLHGAHRIDVAARSATLLAGEAAPPGRRFEPLIETVPARGSADRVQVFRSRDGVHRMRSERIARSGRNRYRWTLVDGRDGRIAGQRIMALGYAPFFVRKGRLAWIAPPTTRRTGSGQDVSFESHGRRLRVIDLAGGDTDWSAALADPRFRGILPP